MDDSRSDQALERFGEFAARIRARLESGKRVYGDSSFERPLVSLVEEIRQEALDVAGWAFILYDRLAELEQRVEQAKLHDDPAEILQPALELATCPSELGDED